MPRNPTNDKPAGLSEEFLRGFILGAAVFLVSLTAYPVPISLPDLKQETASWELLVPCASDSYLLGSSLLYLLVRKSFEIFTHPLYLNHLMTCLLQAVSVGLCQATVALWRNQSAARIAGLLLAFNPWIIAAAIGGNNIGLSLVLFAAAQLLLTWTAVSPLHRLRRQATVFLPLLWFLFMVLCIRAYNPIRIGAACMTIAVPIVACIRLCRGGTARKTSAAVASFSCCALALAFLLHYAARSIGSDFWSETKRSQFVSIVDEVPASRIEALEVTEVPNNDLSLIYGEGTYHEGAQEKRVRWKRSYQEFIKAVAAHFSQMAEVPSDERLFSITDLSLGAWAVSRFGGLGLIPLILVSLQFMLGFGPYAFVGDAHGVRRGIAAIVPLSGLIGCAVDQLQVGSSSVRWRRALLTSLVVGLVTVSKYKGELNGSVFTERLKNTSLFCQAYPTRELLQFIEGRLITGKNNMRVLLPARSSCSDRLLGLIDTAYIDRSVSLAVYEPVSMAIQRCPNSDGFALFECPPGEARCASIEALGAIRLTEEWYLVPDCSASPHKYRGTWGPIRDHL